MSKAQVSERQKAKKRYYANKKQDSVAAGGQKEVSLTEPHKTRFESLKERQKDIETQVKTLRDQLEAPLKNMRRSYELSLAEDLGVDEGSIEVDLESMKVKVRK